jgi:hypothetical protein
MSKVCFAFVKIQETEMKKIFFVVALLIMGGFSLSTASTANAMPALKSIGEVADAKGGVQLTTGYWHWKKHHWRDHYGHHYKPHYYHYGYYKPYYYKHYKWHPHGYYKRCHEYAYQWWCRKDFYGDN